MNTPLTSEKLKVRINSPQAVVWEGEADSVSSENDIGVFDVLPEHANFITMILGKVIIIRQNEHEQDDKKFKFERALLVNKENEVLIYVQI